jgi:RNA polymerase sigma-70 factor (ECF subfamily)
LHLASDLSQDTQKGIEQLSEAASQNRPLTELEAERCMKLLDTSMNVLPEKDRMAFVLREMEGLGYSDLAEMLGISEVATRIRVSRARKRLQMELEKLFHEC